MEFGIRNMQNLTVISPARGPASQSRGRHTVQYTTVGAERGCVEMTKYNTLTERQAARSLLTPTRVH